MNETDYSAYDGSTAAMTATDTSEPVRTSQACPACEQRAMDWLTQYTEAFLGPRQQWTQEQWDRFHGQLGLLIAFTKDIRFQ